MAAAPSPEVLTFLFTDIEGSTRLWEKHPEAMKRALARHDEILRSTFAQRNGRVFKTMGDAFFAVFARPIDAVAAALDAQRSLRAEPWGVIERLKVRMALHSGEAEARDNDYFGPTLNRVARLQGAGYGGQVLLSRIVAEHSRDFLPVDAELRDLGERRLRDLHGAERIFQLVHPALELEFPPLKTLDSRPNNLPVERTELVGRESEVRAVRTSLLEPAIRLVTLTGPGGTGKTRLSLEVAANMLDDFEGGVFFVPLASVDEADLVLPAIAAVVGAREQTDATVQQELVQRFGSTACLLVLDNFEQITAAASELSPLLSACPSLKVLVSSRFALRVYGEREFPVPPLELPDPRYMPPVDALLHYPAVRLFVNRARDVRRDFELTASNAADVVAICRRLGGLPLAIELVAARIRLFPPGAIRARLDKLLPFVTGGSRDLPARQQTLRGAIEWTWDLLSQPERALYRRLSVFPSGCTIEAAERVYTAAGDGQMETVDGLTSLVEKSLLRQVGGDDAEPRFTMLEMIREFAAEQLAAAGEAEAAHRALAAYLMEVVEGAEPALAGPEQATWLDRLEQEHDNIRAAIHWTARVGAAEPGLRLVGAMRRFWLVRGHLTDARRMLDAVLQLPAAADYPAARAKALNVAGIAAGSQGDVAAARAALEQSLVLWRQLGDDRAAATALNNLGILAHQNGDYAAAKPLLTESLTIKRQLGDTLGIALTLNNMGDAAYLAGELDAARGYLEESLSSYRAVQSAWGIANTLHQLGCLGVDTGDLTRAGTLLNESLALWRQLGAKPNLAESLEGFAGLAAAAGHSRLAIMLAASAETLREETGVALTKDERARLVRWLEPAYVAAGASVERHSAAGRAATPEQALEMAVARLAPAATSSTTG